MIALMIVLFIIGYVCIAMEHPLKVNKAATALLLSSLLWVIYIFFAQTQLPTLEEFKVFAESPENVHLSLYEQVIAYVTGIQIIEHLGDVAQILFFLIGAMTIVELVDVHGGFSIITDKITTKNKRKLLWIIAFVTFFLSAILDNLTTSIVMVMLLRKLVSNQQERWIYASVIILAANSGGAFSPIGDVTTIMLWIGGNVTTGTIIPELFLPSLVSVVIPVALLQRFLKGEIVSPSKDSISLSGHAAASIVSKNEKILLFCLGVGALIFVPIFKGITHLPPFIGILFGLSIIWIYTEIMYHRKKDVAESSKARISSVLSRIDTTTILFFLGILMAVAVLQVSGILSMFSLVLDEYVGNFYLIDILIGLLSSVVDNVPLVAGAMGMYPIAIDPASIYASGGAFWVFLAYCAGVGGSILIIGSAAGVVVMGLEKMNFIWYMKKISLVTLLGYLIGAGIYVLQMSVIIPLLK
ncbi:MAG: sodium:proton antiporter NhaD [Paludibacteraceae bacterium]|nr:sodium:proton antiporter NhaD [Paludibacteraceae bacterium]